ncbi:MAG: helix-turn-helix domain-containing protein [Pleurocapsa sp. CRU_1_2]|nr:helix-turn-helix domain-containing protein [Pleurocapsa sp. CRU_1_2]
MSKILLLLHQDKIIAQGLQAFLTNTSNYEVRLVNNYFQCLESANFLQKLGSAFVILVEGQLLDTVKCAQLTQLDQARLILCDRPAKQNSLLLALNCNSSYISLEHNDPQNLILVISCALIGGVFICPQAKKKLNNCVFQSKLEQRQAVESLAPIDRKILALAAQGHNYTSIGEQINYSALNIGYRLKNIVQKLNLQTKQEAIALATSIGLSFNSSESELQEA